MPNRPAPEKRRYDPANPVGDGTARYCREHRSRGAETVGDRVKVLPLVAEHTTYGVRSSLDQSDAGFHVSMSEPNQITSKALSESLSSPVPESNPPEYAATQSVASFGTTTLLT